MNIPFALPLIDQDVLDEVHDCLINTGWLTTGPKVRLLEDEVKKLSNASATLCVNSWTSGAMLMLRWFDIGPGDEVIIPAYTYSATALCVLNVGANVVMVDVGEDFNINVDLIKSAITPRTKAIIPVDIGGYPCDYHKIITLVESDEVKHKFRARSDKQKKLGRPLVLIDAAHSIGATYNGKRTGSLADATVFSMHSVKNVTTGEGGAICINLPPPFDNQKEYNFLKAFALNGQNKSAFEKNQIGAWRYDIIAQGLKINMPDICAAIGLAQIKKYLSEMLPERKRIFQLYNELFQKHEWAILPPGDNQEKTTSCHLYLLRIAGINEGQRDEMIQLISKSGVGVNVHYIPMAMLTLFKELGYNINDYPQTYKNYACEISLPIYNGLTPDKVNYVANTVVDAFEKVTLSIKV